jgi:rRNA maturation RNase YbeY
MAASSCPRIDVRFHRPGSGFVRAAARWIVVRGVETVFDSAGWSAGQAAVLLTNDERLRQLNATFRGIDEPTDVLSFPTRDLRPRVRGLAADAYLGDLAISVPYVMRHAAEQGVAFEHELALMAVHGALHLLGWDHATKAQQRAMWREQERLVGVVLALMPPAPAPRR